MRRIVFALIFASVLPGCSSWLAPESHELAPVIVPAPIYEQLFPNYVELCAVSQFRSIERGEGGTPGHAVMYLKGACLDETADYPKLRLCPERIDDPDDPRHGVGISVNRWFRNVNWIATPGRRLFYDGNLGPDDRLDRAAVEAAIDASVEAGVYEGGADPRRDGGAIGW